MPIVKGGEGAGAPCKRAAGLVQAKVPESESGSGQSSDALPEPPGESQEPFLYIEARNPKLSSDNIGEWPPASGGNYNFDCVRGV
jgi:hypothetical protein